MLPTHRPPTHPGEMLLREFLEPLGVSQVEAARRMHVPFQRLNVVKLIFSIFGFASFRAITFR